MTRGKKPVAAIEEAKKFAERMGYWWQENTNPDLEYDLIIFKPGSLRIIKVRLTRYRINPDTIYENLIPDDLREVRGLPFPDWIPREIWLRTQHERAWRRLLIHELSVGEIGWWGPDDYTNPYAR
ncbi:hypothetical protein [Methanoregula sp.]|uniref:hypothetical protein n=1 Tax=Methanoregula sp. TaxID=2052170 RepID=UPI003C776024